MDDKLVPLEPSWRVLQVWVGKEGGLDCLLLVLDKV